ncbi:hypothetical protein GY45DRAFT_388574 [Cubamyces sp. BRFM 1775]|nr:hypothetical protein GY45DRAFT_388574 [Cubamyces sp. BRFM 1775]
MAWHGIACIEAPLAYGHTYEILPIRASCCCWHDWCGVDDDSSARARCVRRAVPMPALESGVWSAAGHLSRARGAIQRRLLHDRRGSSSLGWASAAGRWWNINAFIAKTLAASKRPIARPRASSTVVLYLPRS